VSDQQLDFAIVDGQSETGDECRVHKQLIDHVRVEH